MAKMYFQSGLKMRDHKAKKPFVTTHEIEWDPKWLAKDPTDYNPRLAIASLALALAACENEPSNGYRYILDTLASFGFGNVDISSYAHRTEEDSSDFDKDVDLVAYAFATTEVLLDDGSTVTGVACIPRATSATIEWNSNGNIADSVTDGDYSHVLYHEGFRKSEQEMLGSLKSYLAKHSINVSEARFLVVGHSRGACIANILGADLDCANDYGLSIPPEHVHVYTFASSPTTFAKDANSAKYANIFNIVHPEDFIPRVPIMNWGFKRFGITMYMPSVATAHGLFSKTRDQIDSVFTEFADTSMIPFHGFYATSEFVRRANDIAGSVDDYYKIKRLCGGKRLTFREYFQLFTNECATSGLENLKVTAEMLDASRGPFEPFLAYFFEHEVMRMQIPFTHSAEAYLARCITLLDRGIDVSQGNVADTCRFTAYGDFDLEVIDGSGETVGRIHEGKPDKSLYALEGYVAVAADKGTQAKMAWVPITGGYSVRLTARSDISEESAITFARQACESDIICQSARMMAPLPKRAAITLTPDAPKMPVYVSGTATELMGMAMQEAADKAEKLSAGVTHEGDGDAVGIRDASFGDIVCVRAYDDGKASFEGWYAPDGTLASEDKEYAFPIAAQSNLLARFSRL